MHDPLNGHGTPLLTIAAGLVALIADDGSRLLALMIGVVGVFATIVRLTWDWQDRRARLRPASRLQADRKRPGASP